MKDYDPKLYDRNDLSEEQRVKILGWLEKNFPIQVEEAATQIAEMDARFNSPKFKEGTEKTLRLVRQMLKFNRLTRSGPDPVS